MKTLKKVNLSILTVAIMATVSCRDKTNDMANNKIATFFSNDSIGKAFSQTLNEINNDLSFVSKKEGVSPFTATNKNATDMFFQKKEILRNIAGINILLKQDRNKIEDLNAQISSYNGAKMRWKKEAEKIAVYIKQKKEDINSLEQQLTVFKYQLRQQSYKVEESNKKIVELRSSNQKLQLANQELQRNNQAANIYSTVLDNEFYKAYYTSGTYKELKKNNVVQKEGRLLGIGSTEILNCDPEKSGFVEIDTRRATGIVITGKKIKLVTPHPAGSYELKKEGNETAYLTIKDPDKFWSNSKYLVVEVK